MRVLLALSAIVVTLVALSAWGSTSVAAAPNGKAIYNDKCSSCHQPAGQGVPSAFPPLAGNPNVVEKNPTPVIKTVLNGLNTPITVKGQKFSGGMPAWKGQLSNAEVAAVITYIRSAWGNKASAVTEKQVAAAAK